MKPEENTKLWALGAMLLVTALAVNSWQGSMASVSEAQQTHGRNETPNTAANDDPNVQFGHIEVFTDKIVEFKVQGWAVSAKPSVQVAYDVYYNHQLYTHVGRDGTVEAPVSQLPDVIRTVGYELEKLPQDLHFTFGFIKFLGDKPPDQWYWKTITSKEIAPDYIYGNFLVNSNSITRFPRRAGYQYKAWASKLVGYIAYNDNDVVHEFKPGVTNDTITNPYTSGIPGFQLLRNQGMDSIPFLYVFSRDQFPPVDDAYRLALATIR